MHTVYILRSIPFPKETYIGRTSDLAAQIKKHNESGTQHTSKLKPWEVIVGIEFQNDAKARAFEQYLKTGSGRAFANRYLL